MILKYIPLTTIDGDLTSFAEFVGKAVMIVNGGKQHPLYAELTKAKDASGTAGKVTWNFEKFLISPDGSIQRFRSEVTPDAPEVVDAIEAALLAEVRKVRGHISAMSMPTG